MENRGLLRRLAYRLSAVWVAIFVSACGSEVGASGDAASDASAPSALDAGISQRTAAPSFSVQGGKYTTAQTVALASTTLGASIYYTRDNNDPNSSSTKYVSPLNVTETTTIRAIALAQGYESSVISAATYTITPEEARAATPSISPEGGTYSSAQTVTLVTTEPSGVILFTTNGTLPLKTNSTVYTTPITVTADTTVIAVTTVSNKADSLPANAAYKIIVLPGVTAAPSFSPPGGEYSTGQSIVMMAATADATICYTVDGNPPGCDASKPIDQVCTGTSARYVTTSPPSVDGNKTVKAVACKLGNTNSSTTTADYTFRASLPAVNASGTVAFDTQVLASVSTPNAVLLYRVKIDGSSASDPDVASAGTCTPASGTGVVAAGSFPWNIAKAIDPAVTTTGMRRNAKYKFRACRVGYSLSAVASADYNAKLTAKLGVTSVTNPAYGVVSSAVTPVYDGTEAAMATLGADPLPGLVCYTGDGTSTPVCNLAKTACTLGTAATYAAGAPATHAGAPISGNSDGRNIRAIACKPGATDSDVLSGAYTFQVRAGADPATPSGSVQNLGSPVNVRLAALQTAPSTVVANLAGSLYYTTNGASPLVPTSCGAAATAPTVLTTLTAGQTGNIDLGSIAPVHSSPSGTTFKFVACATGYTNSAETAVTYSAPDQLAAPSITPASGTYAHAFDTARSPDTPSGTAPAAPKQPRAYFSRADIANNFVCWTDNGSDPECGTTNNNCAAGTALNTASQAGVVVSGNFGGSPRVVRARTCRPGFLASPISSATYTFKVSAPVLPPAPALPFGNNYQNSIAGNNGAFVGPYVSATNRGAVVVSSDTTTAGTASFALSDGSASAPDPVCGISPSTINVTTVPRVVKARACASGFADSDVSTVSYATATVSQPTFTLVPRATFATPAANAAGKYHDYFDILIASTTTENAAAAAGVGICYTTDGTPPGCGSFTSANLNCLNGSPIDAASGSNPSATISPNPTSGSLTVRAIACSTGLNVNTSSERSVSYAYVVSALNTVANADVAVSGNKRRDIKLNTDATVTPNAGRTQDTSLVMCASQTVSPPAGCTLPVAGANYYCAQQRVAGSNVDPEYRSWATKDGTVYLRACKAGLEDATATYNVTVVGTYSRTITSVSAVGGQGQFVTAENRFTVPSAAADDQFGYIAFDSVNVYLAAEAAPAAGDNTFNEASEYAYFYLSGLTGFASAPPPAGTAGMTGTLAPTLTPPALTTAASHGFGNVKYVAWYNGNNTSQGLAQWSGTAWVALTGVLFGNVVGGRGLITIPRSTLGNPKVLTVVGGLIGGDIAASSNPWPGATNATFDKRLVLDLTAGTHPTWTGHVCDSTPIATSVSGDYVANDGFFVFCP